MINYSILGGVPVPFIDIDEDKPPNFAYRGQMQKLLDSIILTFNNFILMEVLNF